MANSIFEELNTYVPKKNKEDIIESRATHIISSAINIIDLIHKEFGTEEAELMEKRFMSSIRGKDPARFTRAIQRVKDGLEDDE